MLGGRPVTFGTRLPIRCKRIIKASQPRIRGVGKGQGGPVSGSGDFCVRAGFWQLFECVYLSAAQKLERQ